MEKKNVLGKIKVERETFEKDGNTYFSYFIKFGNVIEKGELCKN